MSHLLATLAVVTSTAPATWDRLLAEDPRMVATVAAVLAERAH